MRSLLSCLVVGFTIVTVPAFAQSQAKLQGAVNTWQKALAADVKFQQKILADMRKTSDPAKLSRLQATLAEQNRTVQQSQNNLSAAQQQLKTAPAAAAPVAAKLPAVASKPAAAKPVLANSSAPIMVQKPQAPVVMAPAAGRLIGQDPAGFKQGGSLRGVISSGSGN